MKNITEKQQKKIGGFTLIELMIVVAIIGVIAAVAIPSYIDQVRKARRATIVNDIQECAAMQERRYTINNSYSNTICDSINNDDYDIAVVVADQANGNWNQYSITATADSTLMLQDTDCRTFTLDWRGVKGGTDSTNSAGYDRAFCWRDS